MMVVLIAQVMRRRRRRDDRASASGAEQVRHRQARSSRRYPPPWGTDDLEQLQATRVSSTTPPTNSATRLLDDLLTLHLREHYYSDLEAVLAVVARPRWVPGLEPTVEPSEAMRQLRRGAGVDAF